MQWIKNLESQIAPYLFRYKEIPDLFGYYSPQIVADYSSVYLHKILPSDNNFLLHEELNLLDKGVDLVTMRLQAYDSIHLFDLASTTGDSTLPLTLELLKDERVVKYVPVTSNDQLNEFARRKLLTFLLQSRIRTFATDKIRCELEFTDCRGQVLDVLNGVDHENNANLFLLLDSRLGNSVNPAQFLSNIYKSMGQGDYLVIVQSIYRQGTEGLHISDFQCLVNQEGTFEPTKDFAKLFTGDGDLAENKKIIVNWTESNDEHEAGRVSCKVVAEKNFNLAGVEILENEEITVFRSSRFDRFGLENLIRATGFKVLEINFDSKDDNALFFLRKV